MPTPYLSAGATFSSTRQYRWTLWRSWARTSQVVFIMLNPSTADETVLDPTLRRCEGFAKRWGFGGMRICNLFALRSTDPAALYAADDPIGLDNDRAIILTCGLPFVQLVVCGWGVHGGHRQRAAHVARLLQSIQVEPYCLGTTKEGHPKHPLYLKGTTRYTPYVHPTLRAR